MSAAIYRRAFQTVLVVSAALGFAGYANAQTTIENSSEARFQLDLQVPEAVLATFLPKGWSPNIAAQGAAKDCNLRVVFIDRVTINGPDGKPVGKGTNRLVYLVAPVKDPSGAAVQLVIGGLTEDPADAPGPFGNYFQATTHTMQRSTSSSTGGILDSQDWVFAAPTGERLELHIKYERGAANKANPTEVKFYSAKNPTFYQGTGARHSPQRHDQSARPRERVFVQSGRGKLFEIVRRHGEATELGQYPMDQSVGVVAVGGERLRYVKCQTSHVER